jgi:hypothetical protein
MPFGRRHSKLYERSLRECGTGEARGWPDSIRVQFSVLVPSFGSMCWAAQSGAASRTFNGVIFRWRLNWCPNATNVFVGQRDLAQPAGHSTDSYSVGV